MKYRVPWSGQVVERDDVAAPLVEAGIYVPVTEEPKPDPKTAAQPKGRKPR